MLTKSQRPRFLNLVANSPCTPSQPCPKCALILVIRYRFKVFRERFGREPRPTEPLFFDASKKPPVKASLSDAREQIESGAIAVGVDPAPVLQFLQLDSSISDDRIAQSRVPTASVHSVLAHRPQSKGSSVWERFAKDERLHRLHRITPENSRPSGAL